MSHFGWDPLWFIVVITLNLAIRQFTPPVAVVLCVTPNFAGVSLEKASLATLPFIAAMVSTLLLATVFPALSLWLPKLWWLY